MAEMAKRYRPTCPLIECSVTFLHASEGGRSHPLRSGALSGNQYRPHLVIGDPAQRQAFRDGNRLTEEYIGVAFHDGPAVADPGVEITVTLSLIFYPHPVYDKLQLGTSFTVREGARIVGYGRVRKWLN